MTKFIEQKKEEWQGDVAKVRSKKRSEYAAGPAINKWFMETYEKVVKEVKNKNKNPHVLILGATPETRDLVLDYKMNLTIIDQSQEMIEKMTSLMKNKNSKLEIITKGNWLETPFEDNSFNLVLGDGVCNNIEYGKKINFFKEIKRILKKGGIIFLREGILKNEFPIFTIEEILESYRKDKDFPVLFLKLNIFSEISSYDKDKHYFDMGKMFERLEGYKDLFTEKEFDKIMTWRGNLKHSIIHIDELKEIIKSVFRDVEVINNENNLMLSFWPFFKARKL